MKTLIQNKLNEHYKNIPQVLTASLSYSGYLAEMDWNNNRPINVAKFILSKFPSINIVYGNGVAFTRDTIKRMVR